MRLYLSQIREWIVEFSCDMLFISMRTDVAWYRLSKYVAGLQYKQAVSTLHLLSANAKAYQQMA